MFSQQVNAQVWDRDWVQAQIPAPDCHDASISHTICEGILPNTFVVACAEQAPFSPFFQTPSSNLKYGLSVIEYDLTTGNELQREWFNYPASSYNSILEQFIPTKIIKKRDRSGYYVLAYVCGNTPITPSVTNNWSGTAAPVIIEFDMFFNPVNTQGFSVSIFTGVLLDIEETPGGDLILTGYTDTDNFKLQTASGREAIIIKMDQNLNVLWNHRFAKGVPAGIFARFDMAESVTIVDNSGQEQYFISGAMSDVFYDYGYPPYPYISSHPYTMALMLDQNGIVLWQQYALENAVGVDAIQDGGEIIQLINVFTTAFSMPTAAMICYDINTGNITNSLVYEGNVAATNSNGQKAFHCLFNTEIERVEGENEFRIFAFTPELFNENARQSLAFGDMHNTVTLKYNNNTRQLSDCKFYPTMSAGTHTFNTSMLGHKPNVSYVFGTPPVNLPVVLLFSQEAGMVWNNGAEDYLFLGMQQYGGVGHPLGVAVGYSQCGKKIVREQAGSIKGCNRYNVVLDQINLSLNIANWEPNFTTNVYVNDVFDPTRFPKLLEFTNCTTALPFWVP